MKKCVACQRKFSLYDKNTLLLCRKGRSQNKMTESNKMKDMPVNKLMVAIGVGTGVGTNALLVDCRMCDRTGMDEQTSG